MFGASLNNALNALPPGGRKLYNGVRSAGGKVVGTPQSFLSLRSKVVAMPIVYGPYTCQMNLCPSENTSKWTFDAAEKPYEIDFDGRPHNRPHITQCKQIIAENPVACAQFLHAYLAAFADIFLGWPMGEERQRNPFCLFGALLGAYYKYESSTRGGLHAHGQLIQRFLQSKFLRDLIADKDGNGMFKDKLFAFFESTMCAFFPVPDRPLSNVSAEFTVPVFSG
jgi:hypothetical protein